MEMTLGKRPRTRQSLGAPVDDATLLRAVEALDPTRGSVDVAARRWQQVAECVVADTGDDASAELCRKRYEELINDASSVVMELSDDVKAALDKHKAWLQAKQLSGAVEAEETASTGGLEEKTTGSDVDGVKRPRKPATPLKRGGGASPVIKTEAALSMVSPPASGKKRKTSLSPAIVVAREKRKSLLARVTATLDRHEKRPSTSGDDAMESLAARVARNPQEVRVIPPVAKSSPVSKASPAVSPGKPREQARLEKPKPNDVFFSPVKASRPKEEKAAAVVETKTAVVAVAKTEASSVKAAQEEGSDKQELTPQKAACAATTPERVTPESTITRNNVRKVVKALRDAMTAVATTPPRPPRGNEVGAVDTETCEMKAAVTPGVAGGSVSSHSPVAEPPRADEAESAASSEVMAVAEEEEVEESQAISDPNTAPAMDMPSQDEPVDIEMPSAEDVEADGEAEAPEGASSPSPSIEFVAEDEDPGEAQSVAESTRTEPQEAFVSREDFAELKQTVTILASSLTESRAEQTEMKSDLASTQQCLRICEGMCVVLQQQVGTLTSTLSDAQVRNAKLHEEVILLREEIQRGRAARLQELAEVPSTKPIEAPATATAVESSSLPSELHDIREALRVHMETVMAAQETRKAAVAAGFGVMDSQLQQLQAAVDRGEQKREELAATIDRMRSSFESQLQAHEKKYQTMLEEEQQSREEVLATVEREREELERERRKQYQQYQARVDEEQRKRDQLLATFNEKSQRELERMRDVADVNLRVRNELLFKVKAEREEAKTQNVDRIQAAEEKMAALNESLIGVQVGLREHRAEARATKTSQQAALEELKHQLEQLQATLDKKPSGGAYMKTDDASQDGYELSRKVETLSASLAQLQDSLSKQKQANKLRAMEQDSQTKIEWSELRRTLETERSERMRDFSKLLTIVRQSQAGGGNESE